MGRKLFPYSLSPVGIKSGAEAKEKRLIQRSRLEYKLGLK